MGTVMRLNFKPPSCPTLSLSFSPLCSLSLTSLSLSLSLSLFLSQICTPTTDDQLPTPVDVAVDAFPSRRPFLAVHLSLLPLSSLSTCSPPSLHLSPAACFRPPSHHRLRPATSHQRNTLPTTNSHSLTLHIHITTPNFNLVQLGGLGLIGSTCWWNWLIGCVFRLIQASFYFNGPQEQRQGPRFLLGSL